MKRAAMPRTTRALALVCALISGESARAAAAPNPHTWQRWEHPLQRTGG